MTESNLFEYKSFIHDENSIKDFFSTVLLPLEKDEVYYLLCQARKKYSGTIVRDSVIKRNTLDVYDYDRLIHLIKEFSLITPLRKDLGTQIDRDMSVIYIDINPRSMFKAYKDFRDKADNQLEQYYLYNNETTELFARRLKSQLLSSIAKSIGPRKIYTLFDLDTHEESKFQMLIDYIKEKKMEHTVKWISRTHGGYHFIVNASKKEKSTLLEPFYNATKAQRLELPELEIKDKVNTRTPICGTYQGGKPVQKVNMDVLS